MLLMFAAMGGPWRRFEPLEKTFILQGSSKMGEPLDEKLIVLGIAFVGREFVPFRGGARQAEKGCSRYLTRLVNEAA